MKITPKKRIIHGRNALLREVRNNIYVNIDRAGDSNLDKEKNIEKIDGTVA